MKIFIRIFVLLIILGGCAQQQVSEKPLNDISEQTVLTITAPTLQYQPSKREFYKFLFLFRKERKIEFTFYSDKDGCPDFVLNDKGYLYSLTLNQEKIQSTFYIPVGSNIYTRIKYQVGNIYYFTAFKFTPEKNKQYFMKDLNITRSPQSTAFWFLNGFSGELYQSSETSSKEPITSIKPLPLTSILFVQGEMFIKKEACKMESINTEKANDVIAK